MTVFLCNIKVNCQTWLEATNSNTMPQTRWTDAQWELLATAAKELGVTNNKAIRDRYFEGLTAKVIYDKLRSGAFQNYLRRRANKRFVGGVYILLQQCCYSHCMLLGNGVERTSEDVDEFDKMLDNIRAKKTQKEKKKKKTDSELAVCELQ